MPADEATVTVSRVSLHAAVQIEICVNVGASILKFINVTLIPNHENWLAVFGDE